MKWVSVKDQLPELEKPVLCFRGSYYGMCIASVYEYTDGEKFWNHDETGNNCPEVTHWMELPESPKDVK